MRVKVRLFASIREQIGKSLLEFDLPQDSTVGHVLAHLRQHYPQVLFTAPNLMFALNGAYVDATHSLQDGDEVAVIPPVSGGDHVEITERSLDPSALTEMVQRETCGAVVTFLGIARRYSEGKRVQYLEYEAFREMAEAKLHEIIRETKSRWPVGEMVLCHRVGRLEIGEVSLVAVVASPHRAEAFEACHYAVDRLKEIAPIWKKEVWDGGSHWVEH